MELLVKSVSHKSEYDLDTWDKTYPIGLLGEEHIAEMRRAMLDGRIECKVYRPERFDTVFVEVEHYSRTAGRYVPSGLSVTQSDAYAFVGMGDDDATILGSVLVPTEKLRRLVAGKPVVQAARASANPTRGCVLSIAELLRPTPSQNAHSDAVAG